MPRDLWITVVAFVFVPIMAGSNVVTNLVSECCVGGPKQRIALECDESNIGTVHDPLAIFKRFELVSLTDFVNIGST